MKRDMKTHVSSVPVNPIVLNGLKGHSLEEIIKEYIKEIFSAPSQPLVLLQIHLQPSEGLSVIS